MRRINILILVTVTATLLSGCAAKVQGKVVLKGQLPQTYVAIKVDRRHYYHVVGKYKRVLRAHHQGDIVAVRGRVVRESKGLGIPAHFEVTAFEVVEQRGGPRVSD